MTPDNLFCRDLSAQAMNLRQGTTDRFMQLKDDEHLWRPRADVLSFKDVLFHVVDCDYWLFENLDGKKARPGLIKPGEADSESWKDLLASLAKTGDDRAKRILGFSDSSLLSTLMNVEYFGDVTALRLFNITLQHENHHMGQLALSFRLKHGEQL